MNRTATGLVLALAAMGANATNGYFSHGYGIKSKGQAGAGIAAPQDVLTIATNPAGLTAVADGFEVGLDVFRPDREATLIQGGNATTYDANDTSTFLVPEAGVSWHFSDRLVAGVALFGNGGMNTDYGSNPFARFGAQGEAGVDFSQAFLAPAVAYKLSDTQSLGVAVNLAYQRIKLKGIGLFGAFSQDPAHVSNVGYDDAFGWGVRLGWTVRFGDYVTLGATWQSETKTGKFDQYAGLFEGQGDFDIPENFGLGIAVTPLPALTVALDWQRILYSDIPAVGNPIALLFEPIPLGASGGPGFGWDDVDVIKVGASYEINDQWTLRGGYSHAGQPIPASETFFNVLAPAVVEDHVTVGASWRFGDDRKHEVSFSYLHAFEKKVHGSGSIPAPFGGGEVDLTMKQDSFGVAYAQRF